MAQFEVGGNNQNPIQDAANDVLLNGKDSTFARLWAGHYQEIIAGLLVAAVVTSITAAMGAAS